MPAKVKKSQRTRQFIIEKSAPIFNKQGFSGTSLQDIIEATGLTKGSIYGNFEDKNQLAMAAFEFNSHYIVDRIRVLVLSDRNASQKLRDITSFYRKFLYQEELSGGCPLLNTATEADDTHIGLKELVLQSLDYLRRSFVYVMKEGKDRGEIPQHIDCEYYTTIFLALIEGGILQTKLYGKSKFLLDCLRHIDTIIEEIELN